jgi:glycosyltransferase involved in cell wall biosynthesis
MGGARTYLAGITPALASQATPQDRFLLVAQPDVLASIPLPETWERYADRAELRGALGRLVDEQVGLSHLARTWKADVLLCLGSFAPLQAPCPVLLGAANALPFTREYWVKVWRQRFAFRAEETARWLLLQASLRAATRILVPTRSMRQDVVGRLPDLMERVDVALWGVSEVFRTATWRPSEAPLLLGLSKHAVSKDFSALVAAIPHLVERWPTLRVILTGAPDESPWARETARLAAHLQVRQHLSWTGNVPNHAVPDLLASASVAVFPTWCESFGLPLAEALAVGMPAVAGDIPACREVGGEAARYYRPGHAAVLAQEVAALLANPTEARTLAACARSRGDVFRWESTAERTWESLRRAAEERRR